MAEKNSDVTHGEIMAKIGQLEARCDEGCGSKRLPQGIILAIALQTFGIVWWAAGVDNTLQHMTHTAHNTPNEIQVKNYIAEREKAYMEMDAERHLDMSNRMTKVESSFSSINKTLDRIERKLMTVGGRDRGGRINGPYGNTDIPLNNR